MHPTTLRVAGFKSFVEPVELRIEAGVTGIVGPNGCGKSNLVEALRWVMGETAPRQVRGGGMEDVIFGGTAHRPPRDIAEVSLTLDNTGRTAPQAFNDAAEIEVTRRIERAEGSTYAVNGSEVRARDVQLLFADFATGAHSSALVGQGRIGDVIGAKPSRRRALLEEAAGITGLHARRHEAALKLRAAETNLERLQDVIATLEARLADLRRQARHARRYRRLSEKTREAEAGLLFVRWVAARTRAEEAKGAAEESARRVARATRTAADAARHQTEAASVLPECRRREAERAAALHRSRIEHERLAEEETRVARAREENARRRAQIAADIEREEALAADAAAAERRLDETVVRLDREPGSDGEAAGTARTAMDEARQAVEAAERRLADLTRDGARLEAERGALKRRLDEARHRLERLDQERRRAGEARAEAACGAPGGDRSAKAVAMEEAGNARVEAARATLRGAEEARAEVERRERALREALREADAALAAREAERAALDALLAGPEAGTGPALWDRVTVEHGFEDAVGAALGDDLQAGTDEDAPVHWRTLGGGAARAPLPEGTRPLSERVHGPAVLAARLAQIGIVAEADGQRLQPALRPGQRLVSREGSMWRWDGFTAAAAPGTAGRRLAARNRLARLGEECTVAERAKRAAEHAAEAAGEARAAAAAACDRARTDADEAAETLRTAREERAAAAVAADAARARLSALGETVARLDRDVAETEEAARRVGEALRALPESAASEAQAARLRSALDARRARYEERARHHDRLAQAAAKRDARRAELARERERWAARAESARRRLAELAERRDDAEAEHAALDARPASLAGRRDALLGEIEEQEHARREAADALAAAERGAEAAGRSLKAAEEALGDAREAAARCEGLTGEAAQGERQAEAQTVERLGVGPEEARALAGFSPSDALPDVRDVEARLQRLANERENIGAVNLRAETEAGTLDEEITAMQGERADLREAIGRLRRGIADLDREGRERVLAAFGAIDGHFRRLFADLFGGGRAHLALVDSDDPLEAGLEVMASPPGKRLQSISLLSGGEKALTAIALLFGAFLTNPAPICVLDEVDAPLDDSNVERFCDLISTLAKKTDTRFVVVTHHRITMARVDRLFGVTMAEQGVSALVSVDLARAERWRESA